MAHVQSQTTRTKSEPTTPDVRALKRKKVPLSTSSSDEDTPLASSPAKQVKQTKSAAVPMPGAVQATTVPLTNGNGSVKRKSAAKSKPIVDDDNDSDDEPIGGSKEKRAKNAKANGKPQKKRIKKEVKDEDDYSVESEDDKPLEKKKAMTNGKRKLKEESDADDEEDDKPLKKTNKKTPAKRVKKEEASGSETPQPRKRGAKSREKSEPEDEKEAAAKKKKKEEEEEEIFRWWEQQNANNDGSDKWQMLEHNGVYFPPPYEPLPRHVKLRYNGQCSLCIVCSAF